MQLAAIDFDVREGSRSAALTWAQRSIWAEIKEIPDQSNYFNRVGNIQLTSLHVSAKRIVEILRATLSSGSGLRTAFPLSDVSTISQTIHQKGQVGCEVWTVGSDSERYRCRRRILESFEAHVFTLEHCVPARFAIVKTPQDACHDLVYCFSHLLADGGGQRQFERDMLGQAGGDLTAISKHDTVAQAEWQASASGVAISDENIDRHLEALGRLPDINVHLPDRPPRWYRYDFDSDVLHHLSHRAAAVTRTTSSSVLLTAYYIANAGLLNTNRSALVTISANRNDRAAAGAYSMMCQKSLVLGPILDPHEDLLTLICRTHSAAIDAYRHSEFDPDEFATRASGFGKDSHAAVALRTFFNDTRRSMGSLSDALLPRQALSTQNQRPVRPSGEFVKPDTRIYLDVYPLLGGVRLRLLAEESVLSQVDAEAFLSHIYRIVRLAAMGRAVPMFRMDEMTASSAAKSSYDRDCFASVVEPI